VPLGVFSPFEAILKAYQKTPDIFYINPNQIMARLSRHPIAIVGINEDPALRGISYFVWEHNKLKRIRFVQRPYL
jgi:hypothetical protein